MMMTTKQRPEASILVIFGAGGDLSWRKLIPALYNLHLEHWLPEDFAILGVDLKPLDEQEFVDHLQEGVRRFSRLGQPKPEEWAQFANKVHYFSADFSDAKAYTALRKKLEQFDTSWGKEANRIFYQATPPSLVQMIVENLSKAGLTQPRQRTRMVFEKPFGHDLVSARQLNDMITSKFEESQIFRIDHFLGKETVQNILAFRFANALFEPVWDQRYIDHVQITVAETLGVEHRGKYYDHSGALRDMVQNHLMQILCMVAMEPPVSFSDEEIRNKKADVLKAIHPIREGEVSDFSVRGQYDSGQIRGGTVVAYQQEPDIQPDSSTESFAAIKVLIDNWRWQGVPFYMRTGKRMADDLSEVIIQFKPVPHQSFPTSALKDWQPNRLLIHIQPNEGIQLSFQAKQPGQDFRLDTVKMNFTYEEAFHAVPPEPYETLLLDVLLGDATLFMRADQVEAAWQALEPVLRYWEHTKPQNFPNYPAGSWGPKAADDLIRKDGRAWVISETSTQAQQE